MLIAEKNQRKQLDWSMNYALSLAISLLTILNTPSIAAAQEWKREELNTPLRGIGAVVVRTHNLEQLAAFYRTLGFKDWRSNESTIGLHAGGGEALEITYLEDDIELDPLLTWRAQVQGFVPVVGTHDIDGVIANAESGGAIFIEPVGSGDRIDLYYIADPEGNVMGFMPRGPMFGDDMELEGDPSFQPKD